MLPVLFKKSVLMINIGKINTLRVVAQYPFGYALAPLVENNDENDSGISACQSGQKNSRRRACRPRADRKRSHCRLRISTGGDPGSGHQGPRHDRTVVKLRIDGNRCNGALRIAPTSGPAANLRRCAGCLCRRCRILRSSNGGHRRLSE